MTFITPALPEQALRRGAAWEREYKMPVFARVLEQVTDPAACKNCAGAGIVYLSFASDFLYDTPKIVAQSKAVGEKAERKTSYKPLTYFEGNERFRKGWWVIAETAVFNCSFCEGKGTK